MDKKERETPKYFVYSYTEAEFCELLGIEKKEWPISVHTFPGRVEVVTTVKR